MCQFGPTVCVVDALFCGFISNFILWRMVCAKWDAIKRNHVTDVPMEFYIWILLISLFGQKRWVQCWALSMWTDKPIKNEITHQAKRKAKVENVLSAVNRMNKSKHRIRTYFIRISCSGKETQPNEHSEKTHTHFSLSCYCRIAMKREQPYVEFHLVLMNSKLSERRRKKSNGKHNMLAIDNK